jgi:hypothetical protein
MRWSPKVAPLNGVATLIARSLLLCLGLVATGCFSAAAVYASGQPAFIFPSVTTHHPGDRLTVRWQGSSPHATARLTLYGPFAHVSGLKRTPHVHQVAASKPAHGVTAHRQVMLKIVVPRHAKRGFYDLRASVTIRSGRTTTGSSGDMVLRVVPAEHVPTVHPGG